MREIKFRAWEKPRPEDNFNGEMYYSKESEEKRACGFVIETDSGYSNEDFDWMQYTGLKDKNDKEICEGDIVKYSLDGKSGISEVKWEYGEWNVTDFGNNAGSLNIYNTENEIIGNIYENKI